MVAVDLDGGRVAKDLDEARAIRNSLTDVEVLETTNDAKLLLREAYGSANRTGSIGFCMGGGIALKAACDLDFDFCIDYYGIMKESDKVSGLRGPLTLFLGSEDEKITPWTFDSLLPAMKRHRKQVEVYMFPNAGHAFPRPEWKGHNPSAAKAAWSRTLEVLRALNEEIKGLKEMA